MSVFKSWSNLRSKFLRYRNSEQPLNNRELLLIFDSLSSALVFRTTILWYFLLITAAHRINWGDTVDRLSQLCVRCSSFSECFFVVTCKKKFKRIMSKEFFRTSNVLPFSCTHLALWRGKEQGKRPKVHAKHKGFKNFFNHVWECKKALGSSGATF